MNLPKVTAKIKHVSDRSGFETKFKHPAAKGLPSEFVGSTKEKSCTEGSSGGIDRGCRGKFYMKAGQPMIHLCCGPVAKPGFPVTSPRDAQEKIAAACKKLKKACSPPKGWTPGQYKSEKQAAAAERRAKTQARQDKWAADHPFVFHGLKRKTNKRSTSRRGKR